MENSLVRSVMNVQRSFNPERRDAIPYSNHACIRRPRQSIRIQSRVDRRTGRHRDACVYLHDELDVVEDEEYHHAGKKLSGIHETYPKLCEGYLQVAAQLRLVPGTKKVMDGEEGASPSWDVIAQVVCLVDEPIHCPICLHPPIVPRMERCGHIYCGPCVTQYIHYENDGTSKKCAVCCWVFRLEDFKRVSVVEVSPLKVGSVISMALVDCLSNCSVHILSEPGRVSFTKFDVFSFVEEMTVEELKTANQNDISSLEAYKSACLCDGEVEIIPDVNYMICLLESSLKEISNTNLNDPELVPRINLVSDQHGSASGTEGDLPVPNNSALRNCLYQAADGQLIFLDGLMWKCLLAEYGSCSELPKLLSVTVASIKTYKMNQILRKRWRHLRHVPLGHTFRLIEIELDELVSQTVIGQFAVALETRAIERDRNRLEDLRLTRLKEAAENRIPSLPEGFVLSGHATLLEKPSFRDSDFLPLGATPEFIQKPTASTPSFAEVSKMGALSVVDRNRVANFARGPLSRRSLPAFDPASESWPSLADATFQTSMGASRSDYNVPVSLSDRQCPVSQASVEAELQNSAISVRSKKHRRRRTRRSSLHDSSFPE